MSAIAEFVQGNGFKATVIRTNRLKTATVKVEEGHVSVVVPHRLSCERVEALVSRKTPWIKAKLTLQQDYLQYRAKEFVSGESFPYLGRHYRLKLLKGPKRPVKLISGRLQVQLPQQQINEPEAIQCALQTWYENHALIRLAEKSNRYASVLRVTPASIAIRSFKSRWGSCTTQGDVTFNWRIIMAPNRIVDYVVVHELCHLLEHNHGPDFWKTVERVIPDYAECRYWLKVNGRNLQM